MTRDKTEGLQDIKRNLTYTSSNYNYNSNLVMFQMNDKENCFKKSNKRRSLDNDDDFISKKPFNLLDSISEDQKSEISLLDIPDSYIKDSSIHFSTCLTGTFKAACEINVSDSFDTSPCFGTPKSQIITLKEFKNLPKPEPENKMISGTKIITKVENKPSLNKSFSDIYATKSSLNDSFGVLKQDITRNNTFTPMNLLNNMFNHNTPETPCDLYTMDIDSQKSIDCLPKMRQLMSQKSNRFISASIAASPMCPEIENEPNLRRKLQKSRVIAVDSNHMIDESCFGDDDNKITEVSVDFVAEIIKNDFTSNSCAYHIIDCRYPYEYDGGHLLGAVNLYTAWQLLNYIFLSQNDLDYLKQPVENMEDAMVDLINTIINIKKPNSSWKTEAFIFHCEFSSVRGPELARCMRNMDRYVNLSCQSNLFFPKVYIMTKGYKEFYAKHESLCSPSGYVKMEIKEPSDTNDSFSDDGDESVLDIDTRDAHKKMYNQCKKDSQEQMKLFSQLL